VSLEVWRNGGAHELVVTLSEAKSNMAPNTARTAEHSNRLGLSVRPLSPEEHQEAQVESGVLVEAATGPATLAGILPGDIVLAINGAHVNSVEALRLAVGNAHDVVALLIQRGDAKMFVPVQMG
jgi:serine protease Do